MTEATVASLNVNLLLIAFKVEVTPDNLAKSKNATRRKVCDQLEVHGERWERYSGDSFQIGLLALKNYGPL